jgi:hypothetical protein
MGFMVKLRQYSPSPQTVAAPIRVGHGRVN